MHWKKRKTIRAFQKPKMKTLVGKCYIKIFLAHECYLKANFLLYQPLPMISWYAAHAWIISYFINVFFMYIYIWGLLRFYPIFLFIDWLSNLNSACKSEEETLFVHGTVLIFAIAFEKWGELLFSPPQREEPFGAPKEVSSSRSPLKFLNMIYMSLMTIFRQ